MTDNRSIALAAQVAIGTTDRWPSDCVAWVDSRDAHCGKKRAQGFLCTRHHNVAVKRYDKLIKDHEQRQERIKAHREAHREEWEAKLATVNAELNRRTGAHDTIETAAIAGNVHPSIQKKKLSYLSDGNVAAVGKLLREQKDLHSKLGIR